VLIISHELLRRKPMTLANTITKGGGYNVLIISHELLRCKRRTLAITRTKWGGI